MNKIRLLIPVGAALLLLPACRQDKLPHAAPAIPPGQTAPPAAAVSSNPPAAKPIPPEQVAQAALDGELDLINQALSSGFSVDTRDDQGRTLLMYAAFNGHCRVVKKLLAAGADVKAADETGTTSLMFAASGPDSETVQALIEAGAEINAIDRNEHFSALMWAAAEGQLENVKLLLGHGADPSLKDVDGDTAESFAAQRGHTAIVQLLQSVP